MARTVKRAEERRVEFLETAKRLFIDKGYYATSVDDIVGEMGVAKGLFYYYFETKEDLVEAIVDDLWEGAVQDYHDIRDREDLNALEKLMLYSTVRGEVKLQQTYLVELLVNDPHSPLIGKLKERGFTVLVPILAEIVAQGVEEGFFDTQYPQEAAAFLVQGAEALLSTDMGDPDAVVRSFVISIDIWERVLGAERGTFSSLVEEHEEMMRHFATAAGRAEQHNKDIDERG